jgi:hypothetical protein
MMRKLMNGVPIYETFRSRMAPETSVYKQKSAASIINAALSLKFTIQFIPLLASWKLYILLWDQLTE